MAVNEINMKGYDEKDCKVEQKHFFSLMLTQRVHAYKSDPNIVFTNIFETFFAFSIPPQEKSNHTFNQACQRRQMCAGV